MNSCIAFDIGGANIKAASTRRMVCQRPFQLWQAPERLPEQLAGVLSAYPNPDRIGVTMTGELADCFESKQSGVRRIVEACLQVFGHSARFYQTSGRFVESSEAIAEWTQTAASNWHALAAWVAQQTENGFLIDIGSTTVDLIPFQYGQPCPNGNTDLGRLKHHELVYTGVGRSPVSCVIGSVSIDTTSELPLAQEVFATMQDVYLLAGRLDPDPANCSTADGRPLTVSCSRQRIARLLCADPQELSAGEIEAITQSASAAQQQLVISKLEKIVAEHPTIPLHFVVSGQGEWLARTAIQQGLPAAGQIQSIRELVGKHNPIPLESGPDREHSLQLSGPGSLEILSQCAPAYAVACLLEKQNGL